MNPKGGSEILYENLVKHVGKYWPVNANLILSVCDENLLDRTKKNILWQHLSYDQGAITGLLNPAFTQSIDYFIYVSEWQKRQFLDKFNLSDHNSIVIRNAINKVEYKEKPKDKIKLIYTSMPDRGLGILLDTLELMNRTDIELDVYSSNVIYGSAYSNPRFGQHEHLFHRCKTTSYINYKGYALNNAIRKSLQAAHILAYPSIFEETSCLAAIEALAAGCKVVTTNLGALPETCGEWARYVDYSSDNKALTESYANVLTQEIDNYWKNDNLKEQSDQYNSQYSWDIRKLEWIDFIKAI